MNGQIHDGSPSRRLTPLQPPFLQDSPMGMLSLSWPPSWPPGPLSGVFLSWSTKDLARVGLTLVIGAEGEGREAKIWTEEMGFLSGSCSMGSSLLRFPVIFSGSTGLTLLCLPLEHPG